MANGLRSYLSEEFGGGGDTRQLMQDILQDRMQQLRDANITGGISDLDIERAERAKRASQWGAGGTGVGAGLGALVGGPLGASVGGSLGGMAGQAIGSQQDPTGLSAGLALAIPTGGLSLLLDKGVRKGIGEAGKKVEKGVKGAVEDVGKGLKKTFGF